MKSIRNSIVTGAAVLIGALALNPALAAVRDSYCSADKPASYFQKWSAMEYLTHDSISPATPVSKLDQMVSFCRWPHDYSVTNKSSTTPDVTF